MQYMNFTAMHTSKNIVMSHTCYSACEWESKQQLNNKANQNKEKQNKIRTKQKLKIK